MRRNPHQWIGAFVAVALLGATLAACGGPGAAASSSSAPVNVTLSEFKIDMPTALHAGQTTLNVSNTGTFTHSVEITGNGIVQKFESTVKPGEKATLQLNLKAGTYTVFCPVGNHRDRGMQVTVTVT
ncbi:MAG TPA: cupredoxin domain-containing protein [Thermomicrobiaceae bacterium]|nr:cupredoxin domain-containing protein [Thermomicrobiaceae bacterium]